MMKIHELDFVRLKDGREGVEVKDIERVLHRPE